MSNIFTLGQEVGIKKNPILGPQTGIIMKMTPTESASSVTTILPKITDDLKYHVLCRAIFPHKWIVYICGSDDIFTPPPNPYKSTYSSTYFEDLFSNGTIYKVDETSYHIRENFKK